MKRLIITFLFAISIVCPSTLPAAAEPMLVIGKTVATPRIITISAQSSMEENGQLLRDTMAAIQPLASKHYIIRLEPGYYWLRDGPLEMKPNVTIAGSGQNNTEIYSDTAASPSGTVIAANRSELRDLTVQTYFDLAGESSAVVVLADSVTDFYLNRVTLLITDGPSDVNCGLYLKDASAEVTNSLIDIDGSSMDLRGGDSYAIFNLNSSLTLRDTTLKAASVLGGKAWGLYNNESSPVLYSVVIESRWKSHLGDYSDGEACGIGNSNGSNPSLYNTVVGAFSESTDTEEVRAVGIDSYTGSDIKVTGGEIGAYAEGGTAAVGMRCENGSDPWLHATTVRAESYNGSAFAIFTTQDSAGDPAGLVTSNNSNLIAKVTGKTPGSRYALFNDKHYTARFGASLLDGSVLAGGTIICQACYDGNYDALNDSCQ